MLKPNWQVVEPFSAVIFDCDGTLTSIEGIDYLAERRGVYSQVANLTQQAMAVSGLTPALYEQRLNLVKPTRDDILQLGDEYCKQLMPHIAEVIDALHSLNKAIFILSAGVREAVLKVAQQFLIPDDHVHAVDLYFDHNNDYQHFDLNSPLIHNQGKQEFVKNIQKKYSRILYVGDGLNDLAVRPYVSRFVGFGGAFYRDHIAKESDFYITKYASLLPLALTSAEEKSLEPLLKKLYQQGLTDVDR